MTNINIVCEKCGSGNIVADALAEWDISSQEWVMTAVLDATVCKECEDDCRTIEERKVI
tara:strand:+ start:554 stop:730 length:177 start_codon:yes stop_codon:yes gene_type:complete